MIYWPLVDALFPGVGRRCDPVPLSGLRVMATGLEPDGLPEGYGVETYLDLTLAASGARIASADLGWVQDPLRGYGNLKVVGEAVITTILDFARSRGGLRSDDSRPPEELGPGVAGRIGARQRRGAPCRSRPRCRAPVP